MQFKGQLPAVKDLAFLRHLLFAREKFCLSIPYIVAGIQNKLPSARSGKNRADTPLNITWAEDLF